MRSPDNDTYRDISGQLSPEGRTPEMERLVNVLATMRPKVSIDRTYQKELRSRLISQERSRKYIFSLPLWTGVLSTAFAALVGVFALSSIFAPHPTDPIESVAPLGGAASQTVPLRDTTPETPSLETPTDAPVATHATTPSMKSLPEADTIPTTMPADTPMADMMMRSTPPATDGTAMMMTSMAPAPAPDTAAVDTEITDMMAEINTIIHPATVTIALPAYPRQMPLYEKASVYTPSELATHTGASVTVRTVDTISDAALLRKKIVALTAGDQIVGEGQVIYEERIHSGIHTLVPMLSYTLVSGKVISVSLVVGYE